MVNSSPHQQTLIKELGHRAILKILQALMFLKITKLEDYRILHSASLYDRFYNKIHGYYDEINLLYIPDIKFLGKIGLYAHEGIEYLIQLGLGLNYDSKEKPYNFYVDDSTMQKMFAEKDLPYWYFNSIGHPLVKPE